ncbi:hypothetical protein BVRB_6g129110 [Beta vulgaris subsp. vulgaris]|nr:hypothetical protein BVRB_6g129110 [Beta vulgaris subsp. vulgaris]
MYGLQCYKLYNAEFQNNSTKSNENSISGRKLSVEK